MLGDFEAPRPGCITLGHLGCLVDVNLARLLHEVVKVLGMM